jgi:hypothetical protein
MNVSMRKAKWLLPIVIPCLLASAVLGGWRIWELGRDLQVAVPVQQAPAVQTPVVEAKPTPVAQPAAELPDSPIAASEPAPAVASIEPTNKKPTGKKHESEDKLLAVMAMRLHSEAYDRFIHQKGLGMSRMVPTLSVVKREWKKPDWTSEELAKGQGDIKGVKDLSLIHLSSVNFFIDASTKSEAARNDVFLNNALNAKDRKEFLWEIKSLDLVGLVVHETPTVYVSEKLPNMKDLAKRPTRDMDVFEMEGLEELMAGKDLYVRGKNDTIRVLGPVRASKACLKCHSDAKDGDMLGAFSYTLRLGLYQMHGRGLQPQGNPIPGGNSTPGLVPPANSPPIP